MLAVLAPTTVAGATGNNQHNKYDICDFQGFDEESGEPLFVVLSNQSWGDWTSLPPGDNDEVFVPNTLTEGSGDANQFRCSISFGSTGPVGPQGNAGPEGPQGPAGPTGPAGPQGEEGLNGTDGATGSAGPTGPAGSAGPRGDTGETGAPGEAAHTVCSDGGGFTFKTDPGPCPPANTPPAVTPVPLQTLPRTGSGAAWLFLVGSLAVFGGLCLRLWMKTAHKA